MNLPLVKSVLAGLISTAVVMIASPFVLLGIAPFLYRNQLHDGETIGWDPIHMMRDSWIPWAVLALAFAGGFYWQFRKPAQPTP